MKPICTYLPAVEKVQKTLYSIFGSFLVMLSIATTSFGQVTVFDDFTYSGNTDPAIASFNKWQIVNNIDGPIYPASYQRNQVLFNKDPDNASNTIMSVKATCNNQTSSIINGRIQTSGYEYFEGTYAARVYFDDAPSGYQDGSIQTFYSIVAHTLGPDPSKYSEIDFEYLPYDVWGARNKNMWMTSYNSYTDAGGLIKKSIGSVKSYAGWHTLIYSFVDDVNVKFWIDGVFMGQVSRSEDPSQVTVYPRSPMQVAFANWLWYGAGTGLGSSGATRTYDMKVDWFMFIKDQEVSPTQVNNYLNDMRNQRIQRKNFAGQIYVTPGTNIPPTVNITSPANNASFTAPASITINANASDSDGSVTKVDFYNGTSLLGTDNTAPYSFNWTNVNAGSYNITARATDNGNATTTSAVITVVVTNPVVQAPYGGTPWSIPGKIEAENYDAGGQNVAYNDNSSGNSGGAYRTTELVDVEPCTDAGAGYNVGYVVANEWMEYTVNVTKAGAYNISSRVAATSAGQTFRLEMDGSTIATFTVPNTGGWQTWQTVTVNNVSLTTGQKIMRLYAIGGDFNVNFVEFVAVTTTNIPPAVSITSPANNTSYTAPASITINANASDSDGSVTKVDFYNGTSLLGTDNTSPYSFTWSNVSAGSYTITARATDNLNAVTTSAAVTVIVNNPSTQSPYGGTPWSIPGKIEAENYDAGGLNIAYYDNTSGNSGGAYRTSELVDVEPCTDAGAGYNVGYVTANEWLEYTVNVTSAGNYSVQARVAAMSAGQTFRLEMDGATIATFTVPNTGGWQIWQTVTVNNVSLTSGQKIMRLYAIGTDFNINFVNFTSGTTTNVPPTVGITSPANNTSFTSPASITINANAADSDGSVTKVDFYNGSSLIGSDNTSPYSFSWTNVAAGTYTITARATDNSNAVTTSAAITVVVNNPVSNSCSGIAQYAENNGYVAGSVVQHNGGKYECKPWPYYYWCNAAVWAYEPGAGFYWQDAWIYLGPCASGAKAIANEMELVEANPNPVSDVLNVKLPSATTATVHVFNQYGTEVLPSQTISSGEIQLNVSALPAGIYLLKINIGEQVITKTIVKN